LLVGALTLAGLQTFGLAVYASETDPVFVGAEFAQPMLISDSVPEVLTTTRLRQPKSRVPGTTTVLHGELLRKLGITRLSEAFRLVPGMTVGYTQNNRPVVSYHGTVAYDQRRLQLLVDGRTAYQVSLANVYWDTLPVPIDLIERIEVSRGPNAAAYGINAFLGTINIITKSPEDTAGVNIYGMAGTEGRHQVLTSVGDAGDDINWRLAYQKKVSEGYDLQQPERRGPLYPVNDGFSSNTFTYDAQIPLSPGYSVDFRAGIFDGVLEEDRRRIGDDFNAVSDPDNFRNDYFLQTQFNGAFNANHFYHLQVSVQDYRQRQEWKGCPSPEAVGLPDGAPPFCSSFNNNADESRLEFEIQDTIIPNQWLKIVAGASYRKDSYSSDTFFNGQDSHYQSSVFGNAEISPASWLVINTGAHWQRTTITDEAYFSPKIATNFILSDNHTLRFVYSEAVRTPDAFECCADWQYRGENVEPNPPYGFLEGTRAGPRALGTEGLENETIVSREVSYFGQYFVGEGLLTTEVRLFNDQMRDVISGITNIDEWTVDNTVAIDQRGAELEAGLEFFRTKLRLTFAYMDQQGRYTGPDEDLSEKEKRRFVELESRMTAARSGSFAWIQRFPMEFFTSTVYYWTDEFYTGPYSRADLKVGKEGFTSDLNYELAFRVQHDLDENRGLSRGLLYEDETRYNFEARLKF